MSEHLAHDVERRATWIKRPIIVAASDKDRAVVRHAQKALGWAETGEMDAGTKAHLRGIQGLFGLPMTGILDLETAEQIERIREYGSVEG